MFIVSSILIFLSKVTNMIEFLLKNYTLYMYLIPFCVIAFFMYSYRIRKMGMDTLSIRSRVFFRIGIFICGCFISWVMMNHDFRLYLLFPEDVSLGKYLLKLVVCILVALFIPFLLEVASKIFRTVIASGSFSKYGFALGIFTFALMEFICAFPKRMNGWGGIWFAMDYSMGFGSRMMLGSILKLFYTDHLDAQWVYHVVVGAEIIIIALISLVLGDFLKKASEGEDNNLRNGSFLLVLFFIASPGWISSTWQQGNFARFENYTMFIDIIGIILFTKIKNVYVKYIVVTVLSIFSMSVYHGDIFLYYPLILMVMIYDILARDLHTQDNTERYDRKRMVMALISFAITFLSFLIFQFVNTLRYKTYDELTEAILEKSNFEDGGSLYFELFADLKTAFSELQLPFLTGDEMPREKTFLTFIVVLPLVVLFFCIYLKCMDLWKKKHGTIFNGPYLYISLLGVAAIPQFLLNTDWGRWMIALIIVYFGSVLYFCYQDDPIMCEAVRLVGEYASKHIFTVGLMVIWLAGLGKFDARSFLPEVDSIVSIIKNGG